MDSKVVLLLSSLHPASSSHNLAVLMESDAKLQRFHLVDIHLYVPSYTLGKFLFCHLQTCSLVIFIIYNLLHIYLNQVSIKCTVTLVKGTLPRMLYQVPFTLHHPFQSLPPKGTQVNFSSLILPMCLSHHLQYT